ncbi:MAG TPA: hypothetical protein VKQ72_05155 [Aggregatilineales bacterium]|nr:hypothetical protein [Aggregatilineales bacterium]
MRSMNIMKETTLERAFHFTPEDLQQNKEGRLSQAQAQHLRGRAVSLAAIILVILLGAGILTIGTGQADPGETGVVILAIVIPAMIILAVTVGATELAIMPAVVSKRMGTLYLAYGIGVYNPPLEASEKVIYRRFWLGREGAYAVLVDDQEFRVTRDQWQLLPPGAYAVVYWIPTIRKVVSIEILEQPEVRPERAAVAPKPALPPLPSGRDEGDDKDVIRA